MLTTPSGNSGFLENLGQMHRGDAGGLGRLQHAGVPAGEGGRELPRRHQKREIPRNDLPRDAERLRRPAGKRVAQLIRPAGVVEEVRRHQRQIDVAAFLDRLAAIHRLHDGQLARLLLDQPRDAVEILPALATRHFAPDVLVSRARRLHGTIDIMRVALGDLGQLLFRRGIDGGEILPRMRRDEFAVDEVLIARLELDVIVRLRRGRIGPLVAKAERALVWRQGYAGRMGEGFLNPDGDNGSGTGILAGHGTLSTLPATGAHAKRRSHQIPRRVSAAATHRRLPLESDRYWPRGTRP